MSEKCVRFTHIAKIWIFIRHFVFRMRSLRSLSLGQLSSTNLAPDFFVDYGVELEDVKFTRSSIESIKSHTFKHIRGVRRLDLSENTISSIDNEAFTEVTQTHPVFFISHNQFNIFLTFFSHL